MEWLGDLILDALQACWRWIVDTAKSIGEGMMNGFLADIPELQGTTIEPYYDMLQVANQWVPIDMAIAYIGVYWGFIISFIVFKMIIKFIPFIG